LNVSGLVGVALSRTLARLLTIFATC